MPDRGNLNPHSPKFLFWIWRKQVETRKVPCFLAVNRGSGDENKKPTKLFPFLPFFCRKIRRMIHFLVSMRVCKGKNKKNTKPIAGRRSGGEPQGLFYHRIRAAAVCGSSMLKSIIKREVKILRFLETYMRIIMFDDVQRMIEV